MPVSSRRAEKTAIGAAMKVGTVYHAYVLGNLRLLLYNRFNTHSFPIAAVNYVLLMRLYLVSQVLV